ncbi:MAG: hypothetical protein JW888_09115 [Pirellulales bacterium]|nr:hypothetical protein [Pirellulales bacterium]
MNQRYWVSVLLIVVVAGCIGGDPEPGPPEPQPEQVAQAIVPTAASTEAPKETPPQETPKAATPTLSAVPAAQPVVTQPVVEPSAPAPQPVTVVVQPEDDQWATEADLDGIRQKAAVGMGSKGRGYGDDIVTYPLGTYFKIRERISIDQIAHAMQLYKALNGRYPRTQDEFRKQIIEANGIAMATLPNGHKYYYDAEKGELVVIRPR